MASREGYKREGDIAEACRMEKRIDGLALPTVGFDCDGQEDVDPYLDSKIESLLQAIGAKGGKQLSEGLIGDVYWALERVGIDNVTEEYAEKLLGVLPAFDWDLRMYKNEFLVLAFLSQRPEFAKKMTFLADKDWSKFEDSRETKRTVCVLLYNFMMVCDEAVPELFETFFPYYIRVARSPDVYDEPGLDAILDVGKPFIPLLKSDSPELVSLMSLYLRFIHHTDGEISSRAIEGTVLIVTTHDAMLSFPEFKDKKQCSALCERLTYLGGQFDDSDPARYNELCQSVVLLLSLMLCKKFLLDDSCYCEMGRMITQCMRYKDKKGYSRCHVLGLLANCLGNEGFLSVIPVEDIVQLVKIFYTEYSDFRLDEKKEASYVFANIIYFLQPDVVSQLFQIPDFFSALLDVLDLVDDEAGVVSILDALCNQLHKHRTSLLEPYHVDALATAVSHIKASYNDRTSRAAEMVLSQLLSLKTE